MEWNNNNKSTNHDKKNSKIVTISDFRLQQNPQSSGIRKNSRSNTGGSNDRIAGYDSDSLMFCQPVRGTNSTGIPPKVIPALVISNIPKSDICEETLQRIMMEFEPIIRRRGYNIRSVSELCCCGDGLDSHQGGHKRKLMSHNILGYNMTTSQGRRGSGGYKSHTIHLRLRNPQDHSILYPYEDVAGTMAHELAHCVHGPHDSKFFTLMEEIMEEHDRIQIYGPHGPLFLKPVNAGTIGRIPVGMPSRATSFGGNGENRSGTGGVGRRLGGQGSGKSRLVDLGGFGRKLGGGGSHDDYNPRQLRELARQAAESRKRKMDCIRRSIEQANTTCVIDLTDNSDDEDEGIHKSTSGLSTIQYRNKENRRMKRAKKRTIGYTKRDSSDDHIYDQSQSKSKSVKKERALPQDAALIDLTGLDEDGKNELSSSTKWTCRVCSYANTSDEAECEVCLSPK